MYQIKIPTGVEGDASTKQFQEFCLQFNCTAVSVIREACWLIRSDDPANFFWLGSNINFKLDGPMSMSISSKILGK